MKPIYKTKFLRRLILSVFSRLNPGDISIRHHYTGHRIHIHSFKHKGYWFHGMRRERSTMLLFEELTHKGDVVIEVGSHIGYIAAYLATLVGDTGQLIVFEPGPNNLPYLRKNIEHHKNVSVIPKAVGQTNDKLPFYLENLTGQNNTLVADFEIFQRNVQNAGLKSEYETILVDVVTLDNFLESEPKVDFIKIDVEGAELDVLLGAGNILKTHKPIVMVESNRNGDDLYDCLSNLGYIIFSSERQSVSHGDDMQDGNFFCLHPERHSDAMKAFNQSSEA